MKKLAFLLIAALCLSLLPVGGWAEAEPAASEEIAAEAVAPQTEAEETPSDGEEAPAQENEDAEAPAPEESVEPADTPEDPAETASDEAEDALLPDEGDDRGSAEAPVLYDSLPAVDGSSNNKHIWDKAYLEAIRENTTGEGCVLQLVDTNADGIPELLIGTKTGNGLFSIIKHMFTYRDDSYVTIQADNMTLGSNYRLYRNTTTGEGRLEADYSFRDSFMSYSNGIKVFTLTGDVFSSKIIYRIDTNNGIPSYWFDGVQLDSEGAYDARVEQWYDGWTKVKSFVTCTNSFSSKPTDAAIKAFLASYPGDFFLIGEDNNRFWHNEVALGAGVNYVHKNEIGTSYAVSAALFGKLASGLSWSDEIALLDKMNTPWRGACEGITLSMILANAGMLDISLLQEEIECYHDLPSPGDLDLPYFKELINYYQLLQTAGKITPDSTLLNNGYGYWPGFKDIGDIMTIASWDSFWEGFFEAVKAGCNDGTAVLLSFGWDEHGEVSAHSVVVCGIDDSDDDYTIVKLYDCNAHELHSNGFTGEAEQYTYLIVFTGDLFGAYLADEPDTWSRMNAYFLPTADAASAWKYFKYYSMGTILSIDRGTDTIPPATDGDGTAVFETEGMTSFTLKNSAGQILRYDGTEFSGDMPVTALDYNTFDEGFTTRYTIPSSDAFELTDYEDGAEYKIICGDSYFTAGVSGADAIVFSDGRGVEIAGTDYTFSVGVSLTDTVGLMRLNGRCSGNGQFLHSDEVSDAVALHAAGSFSAVSLETITQDDVADSAPGGPFGDAVIDKDGNVLSSSAGKEDALDAAYILQVTVGLHPGAASFTPADAAGILRRIAA